MLTAAAMAICAALLLLLAGLALYQWAHAAVALRGGRPCSPPGPRTLPHFLVLVPAHDEEALLPITLQSIRALRYPQDRITTVVVADRCSDATAQVAGRLGARPLERRAGPPGKGAAIAWALEQLRRDRAPYDALVIVDADTEMDADALTAFAAGLEAGHAIQQAYNDVGNPEESLFTRIISVTSTLRNRLFYQAKAGLGLSGLLLGTGMCVSRPLIDRQGWTAFSVGEDWEISVHLLLAGMSIHFNGAARVFARESRGMREASPQRLRWASGRYAVVAENAWRLVRRGVSQRRPELVDAAVTLATPNYSSQATLALLALGAAWALPPSSWSSALLGLACGLVLSHAAFFAVGCAYSPRPLSALKGVLLIPVVLPWRLAIELLAMLGYGRRVWLRSARPSAGG
jgi:cellulose synthase/poly-beta-1,6-N-acetylglucosamine synthase-like glycosyltransferase